MFTGYCDNLAMLGGMVERVAHKHVSCGVIEEQYPVVGRALIQALKVNIWLNIAWGCKHWFATSLITEFLSW